MISLFQIASNDQSVAYLGSVFGVVHAGVLSPQSAPMLMGVLFKVFNTSILTLGAAMVVYTTIVGLLKTAQEGEFLGKQWSSLWVPLRTVFGIAALFPLPTGYSVIQVFFMWIILQGVGAADTLWNTTLDYTAFAGSPTGEQEASQFSDSGLNLKLSSLFQGLICQAHLKKDGADYSFSNGKTVTYYCAKSPTDPFCTKESISTTLCQLDSSTAPCSKSAEFDEYRMGGQAGICGVLQYCSEYKQCTYSDTNKLGQRSLACAACKAQKNTLNQIIPLMSSIAQQVAKADEEALLDVYQNQGQYSEERPKLANYTSPDWIITYCQNKDSSWGYDGNASCLGQGDILGADEPTQSNTSITLIKNAYWKEYISPRLTNLPSSSRDVVAASQSLYVAAMKQATLFYNAANKGSNEKDVNITTETEGLKTTTTTKDYRLAARQQGWIYAGSYFYQIIRENSKNIEAANPHLDFKQTDLKCGAGLTCPRRNNFTAAASLIEQMSQDVKDGANQGTDVSSTKISISLPGPLSALNSTISSSISDMNQDFRAALSKSGNPIFNIADFGIQQMKKARDLYFVMLAIVFTIGAVSGIAIIAFGNGMTLNPLGEGLKAISGLITPFFILYLVAWYVNGALLSIYLPLIPFMVFAMGAIGWILATVEAMVAAPIVALGLLSQGGQSEVFGRAEPALMLLLNLFLRPSLMVVGLMAGALVSMPVIKFINLTFNSALVSAGESGLFISLILFYVYTTFVIVVFSKCYTLIYVVPERVLTWIGGPAVQYGEAESLQAVKQATEGATSAITGASREMAAPTSSVGGALGSAAYKASKKQADIKAGGNQE